LVNTNTDGVLCQTKNLKAMEKLLKLSVVFLLLIGIQSARSQSTKEFPKEINSIKMTAPGIAIVATDDALYGIDKDGKELWKNEKLKKVDAHKIVVLEGSELIVVTGGLMMGTKILNVYNGKIHAGDSDISEARIIHGTNQLWVSTRLHGIHVWDISTDVEQYTLDKVSTPFGVDQKNNFSGAQPITYTSASSAILHIGPGQLGEYDLNTGAPIWEFDWKPFKIKKLKDGKGDRASYPTRGYAIMKLDQESNTLYFPFREGLLAIDTKTGKAKWDLKANKTGQVKDMYVTDDGVVVLTYQGLQLIDKETGATKWDKTLKIKGASEGLLINNKGTFYIVSKKSIEKIDIANKKSITLVDKIKFEGDDSFSGLELINGKVILSGSQNVVGIDKESGKILFSTYYKAPGASIASIAANVALAGVAMAATQNSMRINSQSGSKTYYQYTPTMRKSGGSNSNHANNSLYISTKFKGGDTSGFGIAKVDKESGKTTKKFVIGDRDPMYVVDENNGIIFYKSDKKELAIKTVN